MRKNPIIFLCQRVPYPPDRGDRIETWNFIRHLSKQHEVHLFCLTSDMKDFGKKAILSDYCKSVNIFYKPTWRSYADTLIALFFSKRSLSNAYYFSMDMESAIAALVKKEDASTAFSYSSNMFTHIRDLKIKKIFYLADVDSEKWKKLAGYGPILMRPIYRAEYSRLRRWELECGGIADRSIVVTEEEENLFRSIGAKGEVVVIKNGVDLGYFKPDYNMPKEEAVIFTGVMDYPPNIDAVLYFYHEVFPKLKSKKPDIKFYIAGRNPVSKIRNLAKRDKNCIVTGYVKDIRPFVNKAMLSIAPMRIAQGIQNKVLEAMAMELPVITTSGISRSLKLGRAQGLIAADDPDGMAEAVLDLLNNAPLRLELGRAGRKAISENYSWDKEFQKLDEMLKGLF